MAIVSSVRVRLMLARTRTRAGNIELWKTLADGIEADQFVSLKPGVYDVYRDANNGTITTAETDRASWAQTPADEPDINDGLYL
ncbi:MAG: hypothetical protein IPL79_20030 [Myxococcales bacterium]|nr:hypothetical protein [Myxococcales bacterium]